MIKFTCHNSNDNNIEQEHFLVLFTPLKRKLMYKSTSTSMIIELAFLYNRFSFLRRSEKHIVLC